MNINIRSWLFTRSSRVVSRELKDIALFIPTDLVYLPLIGWKNIGRAKEVLRKFQVYRGNLYSTSWSSLTKYYPRPLYLWYYYQLFWWADFCEVTTELITEPDRSLVAELFIRYIVEIDSLIDCSDSRLLLTDIKTIKALPSVNETLHELLSHIFLSNTSSQTKKTLCHQIWEYRSHSLSVCKSALYRSQSTQTDIIHDKEKTGGDLFRTWASLLSELYCVKSKELAQNSGEILANIAMAIQVLDDMLDFPIDYREGIDNIFHVLLKETPTELERAAKHLETLSWKHLDWRWARMNLPLTCRHAIECVNEYLEHAIKICAKPKITHPLCGLIRRWSRNALGAIE